MKKNLISLLSVIVVLCLQFTIYLLFFHSNLVKWGATEYEVTMPMPGDNYAERISCTRSIDINKPTADVWAYLVDLGADRKGFYSFGFIEKIYGCEIAKQIKEENRELKVGRVISADSAGKSKYGFKVIEVVQGQSMVLEGWGGFLINKIDENNSRLIIRTHDSTPHNVLQRFNNSVFDAMHYIMEKRMMLGIKDLAESNGVYTTTKDLIWFLCIFISGLAGLLMIFFSKVYMKLVLPSIFFTIWQFTLLVLDPKPFYGIVLIIIVSVFIVWIRTQYMSKGNKSNLIE